MISKALLGVQVAFVGSFAVLAYALLFRKEALSTPPSRSTPIAASDYGVRCDGVTDDTSGILEAFAAGERATSGAEITLPFGRCVFTRPLVFNDKHGVDISGRGIGETVLLATTNTDGLRVVMANKAPAELDGFTIQKKDGANGHTAPIDLPPFEGGQFAGTGLYVGNIYHDQTGHLVIHDVEVAGNYTGQAWNVSFDFDTLSNFDAHDLEAIGTSHADIMPEDVPAPTGAKPKFVNSLQEGFGVGFLIHGHYNHSSGLKTPKNAFYLTDSSIRGLVEIGNNVAIETDSVQGLHVSDAHVINVPYGFIEYQRPNAGAYLGTAQDEAFHIEDSLFNAVYGDIILNGATDSVVTGNTLWHLGGGGAIWTGLALYGNFQDSVFNNNTIEGFGSGYGIVDCMRGFYAHTIVGNSLQFLSPAGIYTCAGGGGGMIAANSLVSTKQKVLNNGADLVTPAQ